MRYLQVTCMLAFMGSEHGECPHAGQRVLQLVIEESSVSTSRTRPALFKDVDCSLRHHEGIANSFCVGDNIPRDDGAVAVNGDDLNFNFEIANQLCGIEID
jgi:hypothetical protein